MKNLMAVALLALLAACGPTTPAAPPALTDAQRTENDGRLNAFLDAEYEKQLALHPEALTQLGRKDQYDKLDDYSEAFEDRELEAQRASVAAMKTQFDPNTLTEEGRTSFDMWAFSLERAERAARFRRHAYIYGFQGPHAGFAQFMVNFHKVDTVADMEAYAARLRAIGPALDQLTDRAKLAAADGIRMPAFNYSKVANEARSLISGQPFTARGPDNPLWADAKAKIAALVSAGKATPAQAATLTASVRAALIEGMKPGYDHLVAWATEDAARAPSGNVGAGTLPNGADWYATSIFTLTSTNMTADEIHQTGLAEVARIHAEMEAIKNQVGFQGDLKAFFRETSTNPRFFEPNTDAGRAAYIQLAKDYLAQAQAKLPEYFGRLPRAPLDVRRVEPYREEPGGAAHYSRPTPDGSTPGIFYMHLSDMRAEPIWDLESVAYHEGVPGHHLQIAIANELTDVPLFRRQAFYSSFSEGWALYCESLAKEMGFYHDPYSDYGRLAAELWRAVRLVVDSGMHGKGWTEEQAVQYALDNTPKPEAGVRAEVHRYILWPGQATTYKIGQLTISRLRAEAQQQLGDKFDIKGFHDTVVDGGAMPLPVLEARVHRWVERVKAGG
jgi:uncharacterized protein (DUF885 family)